MSIPCGLIGLPNVGKSTIFKALTAASAEIANYPFCTIEPNIGMVSVPDQRLIDIARIFNSKSMTPTVMQFVDIAGLVAGASTGEGLGNKFLAHIRECSTLGHVLRCFDDAEIAHVAQRIDPISDFETVITELALADIQTLEKRLDNNKKLIRSADSKKSKGAQFESEMLTPILDSLQQNIIPHYDQYDEDIRYLTSVSLSLLTAKKQMVICNIDEQTLASHNEYVAQVRDYMPSTTPILLLCGKLEAEIAQIDAAHERAEFLNASGLAEPGLNHLIRTAYRLLGLQTFFTAGEKESRAWTIGAGSTAQTSAGKIHTDFESGFIKADIYHYSDLISAGSEQLVRKKGLLRTEGKEYIVKDGDVVFVHAH